MRGIVYLVHFEGGPGLHVAGGRHARHYIGWTTDRWSLVARLGYHRSGQGSRLCRAAVKAGHRLELVRVWVDEDRYAERRLKNRRQAPRFCPLCAIEQGRGIELGLGRTKLPREELDVVRGAAKRRRHTDAQTARHVVAALDRTHVFELPDDVDYVLGEAA